MATSSSKVYRVREFANLAGVTVKTLYHYDRIGLMKARRTGRGYRVYRDSDLPRLQQILVFRFLGLSLPDIGEALKSEARRPELLKNRRYALKFHRHRLGVELQLCDELQDKTAAETDWADLASFVRDFGRNFSNPNAAKNRQLDEARRLVFERRMALSMTLEEYELNRDVRAAIARGDTPDTPAGQVLVARWRSAIERFTAGDCALKDALALVMADRPKHPGPPWASAYRAYMDRALAS